MPFSRSNYDAVVIGSGPNGLAAAITVAQAGRSVLVIEGKDAIGGGTRTAELTLPGYLHDVCSAVHPMGLWSPFFRSLPLAEHGLEWVHPPAPLAHPLDDGTAVIAERSVELTAENMGRDAERYTRLMGPLVSDWPKLESTLLAPLRFPSHPFVAARFGLLSMRSAAGLAESAFQEPRARALFGGLAAHSILPLEQVPSALFGILLGIHVARGWLAFRAGRITEHCERVGVLPSIAQR